MATKQKPTKSQKAKKNSIDTKSTEDTDANWPRTVLRPTVQATATIYEYGKSAGNLDLIGLLDALSEQTKAACNGNLKRAESMLTAQAHSLDAIFNKLAQRAVNAEYLEHLDCYLKLALRAQSQCRATWETLAAIKNPPMMGYVKQANIAHGHQQVNNVPATAIEAPRTREKKKPQNKLLGENDGERLDTRATGAAGGINPAMEAVGEINRAEDTSR